MRGPSLSAPSSASLVSAAARAVRSLHAPASSPAPALAATATATAAGPSAVVLARCPRRPRCHLTTHPRAQLRAFATTAPAATAAEHTDITIVGGGVAGLALACALTAPASPLASLHAPPSLTLIDAGNLDRLDSWPPPAPAASSSSSSSSSSGQYEETAWENRTVSLSADNLAWLLSDSMADAASDGATCGIRHFLRRDRMWDVHVMTVSDGLTGAAIEFGSDDEGYGPFDTSPTEASHLSTMVELSNLQQALLKTLRQRAQAGHLRINILQRTKVQSIVPSPPASEHTNDPDPWPLLTLASASASSSSSSSSPTQPQQHQLRTRLLIGADGHGSPVRTYAGIRTFGHDYNQRGLVSTLRCRPGSVGRTAYQRFLPTGPIAFLPMSSSAASMVWTLPPDMARALEALQRENSSGELLAHLINAAYRLPWHSIDYLFARIREFLASTPAPAEASARDWAWLATAIDERIRATLYKPAADVEASGGVPDAEYSASVGGGASSGSARAPPKVVSVDARSTASFPLLLRHAEAYTGASLRAPADSARPSLFEGVLKPSRVLEGLMGAAGLMRGVQHASASTSTAAGYGQGLTAPEADGHAAPPARSRTVLVGDAAHTVHPLAGQGLNQGLLDVRALSAALGRAVWEEGADLGLAKSLGAVGGGYERERWGANALWASGIDKLGALFSVGDAGRGYTGPHSSASQRERDAGFSSEEELGIVRLGKSLAERALVWGRSTGLEVLNELGPVKQRMVRGAGSPSDAQPRR